MIDKYMVFNDDQSDSDMSTNSKNGVEFTAKDNWRKISDLVLHNDLSLIYGIPPSRPY